MAEQKTPSLFSNDDAEH